MTTESSAPRERIYNLLRQCNDAKILVGQDGRALELAEKAYRLTRIGGGIFSPWPQLAAYRLAHLRFREKDLKLENLQQIDSLFDEANKGGCLGALPLVYKLAVFHRLAQFTDKSAEVDRLKNQIKETFAAAMRHLPISSGYKTTERIEIQPTAFNLLEFASYLFALPYAELVSWTDFDQLDPLKSTDWIVGGTDIGCLSLSRELAQAEFESLKKVPQEGDKVTVFLEIHEKNHAYLGLAANPHLHAEWNVAYAKRLFHLLLQPRIATSELMRKVLGADGNVDTFRQHKARIKVDISELTEGKIRSAVETIDGRREVLSSKMSLIVLVKRAAIEST